MTRRLVRAVAAVALAVAVAGCGVRPTGILSARTKPIADGQPVSVTLYLVRDSHLVPVTRPGLAGHPDMSLEQLGIPVTADERRKGLHNEVPGNEDVSTDPVDRPGELHVEAGGIEFSHGALRPGTDWTRAALGQLVCTAQAIPGVSRVRVEDSAASDPGGAWLTCADFSDLIG